MSVRRRTLPSIAATAVLAAGLTLAGAGAANAATITVFDTFQLEAALHNGTADTIVMGGNFNSVPLVVAENDTLEMNGKIVEAPRIEVGAGVHLTIQSSTPGGYLLASATDSGLAGISTTLGTVSILSGEVRAYGFEGGAGIGGDLGEDGGILNISGGTVKASGDDGGAGIGGGRSVAGVGGKAGTITITGGTVTAVATLLLDPFAGGGAGIGGGLHTGPGVIASGGTVSISGTAVVDATGSYSAAETGAGIGGGGNGNGGSVTISGDAEVSAGAMSSGAGAIGGGSGVTTFGTLSVDDTSRLRVYGVTRVPSGVTVTGAGTIWGGTSNYIDNYGSIQPTVEFTGTFAVNVNNFPVTFDPNYAGAPASTVVPVYATTMAAGARSIPAAPVRAGYVFTGWNAATDGSGATFTTSTVLSAATTVYAQWEQTLAVSGAASVGAGTSTGFTADQGATDVTAGVTFTTSDSAAIITADQIEFRTAGTITVTATLDSNPAVTGSTTIQVTPGSAVTLTLTPSATSVPQGGSITVGATAVDAYGNSLGNVASSISLSSSVATDVISGNTVTFPHASPHTITATLGAANAAFVVQVIPAAAGMANTGFDPRGVIALGVVLLAGGGVLLIVRRVRAGVVSTRG